MNPSYTVICDKFGRPVTVASPSGSLATYLTDSSGNNVPVDALFHLGIGIFDFNGNQALVTASGGLQVALYTAAGAALLNDAAGNLLIGMRDEAGNQAALTATGQQKMALYTPGGVAVTTDGNNNLGVGVFDGDNDQLEISPSGAAHASVSEVAGTAVTHAGGTQVVAAQGTGMSANGNVGAASAQIRAANASASWMTIQNTHATQSMYLSFTDPATNSDVTLGPGASITWNVAPTNAIFAIGSGAGTTFAIMEVLAS